MKLAIMQPYFLPYIGYFQLVNAVDEFIVYDNIKYTKKGWINRNRLLQNGSDSTFSLPLKKGSDQLHIVQRELAPDFNRKKLLNQFYGAYAKAPYSKTVMELLEHIIQYPGDNLFEYLLSSIRETCSYLGISTKITISSTIDIDHNLKAQEKVIALCKQYAADTYINPIGGTELYSASAFEEKGISLKFLKSQPWEYSQFSHPFIPWLSIVDVLMFNPPEEVKKNLEKFSLLKNK